MYVCVMCVYACAYKCIYVYAYAYVYIYIYVHMCVCVNTPTHVYIYACAHANKAHERMHIDVSCVIVRPCPLYALCGHEFARTYCG